MLSRRLGFNPARVSILSYLAALCLLSGMQLAAKPITVTALAHNDTPKHIHAQVLPYANPNAPKGGTLSRWANGSFDSFNNMIDKGQSATGLYYVYESLMQGSLDEAFSMYPLLAEKVTYDPNDASWVIYHINPKARFHDGSPVTAEDVQFTFDKLLTEGAMFYKNYLAGIKKVQPLDTHRVKFTFKNAKNLEMKLLVGQISIISKKYFSKHKFNAVSLEKPMGSGAYKIKDFQAGRSITYERDPNYWGKDLLINKGAYNFDKIVYRYYRSSEIAFEGFKAGQYIYRQENKSRNWAVNYDFPAVKKGMVKREEIKDHSPIAMQAFVLNNRRDIFKDVRVRKAVTLAYDFEWMNKTLFYNLYERLHSNFQSSELEASGKPSAAELSIIKPLLTHMPKQQQQDVLKPLAMAKSDGTGFNRNNLLQARKLLLAAGFTYKKHLGKTVLYQPNGKLAKIDMLNYTADLNRIFLPYVRNLKRLGFTVNIRLVDIPQFIARSRDFDFDVLLGQFPQSLSPGQEQMDFWSSVSAKQSGSRNSAGVSNKAIDIVIDKLTHASNRKELILYAKVLDRLLITGYYYVPTYGKSAKFVAYWKNLRHPKQLPKYDVGINYWWINKKADAEVAAYLGK